MLEKSNYPYPVDPDISRSSKASPRNCLTDEEVEKLYQYAYQQLHNAEQQKIPYTGISFLSQTLLVVVGLNTGLRITELTQLCWGDFLIDSECVFVREGKFKKSRYVYYSRELVEPIIIQAHILFKQWGLPAEAKDYIFYSVVKKSSYTKRALQTSFKRILERSDIRLSLSPHSMRHTFSINLYHASNSSIRVVQKQLGHTDIKTTQIYLGHLMPAIKKTLENLYLNLKNNLNGKKI